MKLTSLILALIGCTCMWIHVGAQSFDTTLPRRSVWEGSATDKLVRINEHQFALLIRERSRLKLKCFNDQLELLYEVELNGRKDFTEFHYDAHHHRLVTFSMEKKKDRYRLIARAFHADSGELLKEEYLYEGKALPRIDCQFNEYFFAVDVSAKPGEVLAVKIYNYDFLEVRSMVVATEESERVLDFCFDQEGNQYVITFDKKANSILLNEIDSLGHSINHLAFNPHLSKVHLGDLHAVPIGNGQLVLVCQLLAGELSRYDLYHADMEADTVIVREGSLLREDSLTLLYEGLTAEHSVQGVPITKKVLKNSQLQDILIDEENTFYLITEQMKKKTNYQGGDVLISKFKLKEGNVWNSIVPRNAKLANSILGKSKGVHNLAVKVFMGESQLYVVTTESKGAVMGAYLRKINLTTGEVTPPQVLMEGRYIANQNYTQLLDDDTMVMLISHKVMSLNKLSLQSIDLKE